MNNQAPPYIKIKSPEKLAKLKLLSALLGIALAFGIGGCHPHEEIKPAPVSLVTSNMAENLTATSLQFYVQFSGFNISASSLQYSVDVYRITYNTTLNGQPVVGSGLVVLPVTSDAVGMVSFQHGTIVSHAEAPSVQANGSLDFVLYGAIASPGFIAVIPDYLGFGSSSEVLHPYFVKDAMSTAVLDMLKAAKELAAQKNVKFNGKLFLAGYSEGGYATMAAHRAIEKDGLDGFTLVASFPASGGYDVKGMQEYLFGLTLYDEPFYLAYVALAYQDAYQWTEPMSKFIQEPYATALPGLFDGSKNGSEINAMLTDSIARLVNTDLRAHIDTDPQFEYIASAFQENSLLDWKPAIKMFLYHGDADVTVPYQNSVDTYNRLIANGASPDVVTLTALGGKTHETGVQPYIESVFSRLLSMQ